VERAIDHKDVGSSFSLEETDLLEDAYPGPPSQDRLKEGASNLSVREILVATWMLRRHKPGKERSAK
jgi:hypothetical protein